MEAQIEKTHHFPGAIFSQSTSSTSPQTSWRPPEKQSRAGGVHNEEGGFQGSFFLPTQPTNAPLFSGDSIKITIYYIYIFPLFDPP